MANLMNLQYGSKAYQLPKSLIINEEFIKEIVSANVWNNKLRKSDKMNLLKFLPDFPNNDTHEKKETLKKLFLGKQINFENQIKTFVRLAKDGDFNSSIKIQKGLDLLLKERNRKISLFKHRLKDLEKIINTKKSLSITISDEEEKCMKEFQYILDSDDPLSDIVDQRFNKIMEKITSDPDEFKKSELYAEYQSNTSLEFKSLSLCDVINRCQNENETISEEPFVNNNNNNGNGPMTRKRRQLQNGFSNSLIKYAKFNESSDSQSDSSDDCRSNEDNSDDSVSSDTDSVGSGTAAVNENHKRVRLNRHERREFRCPQDDFSDYFSLLQRLFAGAHQQKLTTHQIEDRIRHWHIVHKRNIGDNFNRWAVMNTDWVCLAVPALTYLSLNEFSIVDHRKKSQTWRWKNEIDNHVLRKLFNEWHQISYNTGGSGGGGSGGGPTSRGSGIQVECEQIPPPLFQTEWRVRTSSAEERLRFQMQERKRFMRPWRGFIYNVHGYNCAVAPIRGCLPGRDYSNVKARGHPLLVNDRPPHVNIVEIVRDAVARLPNGEGSRADIVALAMDSAFWNCSNSTGAAANEKSISQCISSALDRLQGEGCDPSVKYNARLKLWFYRHRNKSLEELEQIHLQQHNQQDDIKRYRNNTNRPSSSSALSQQTLPTNSSLLYGQIVLNNTPNSNNSNYPQQQQHISASASAPTRYGQVQTYQQFSQAVNHARDHLSLQQSIYISRPPPPPPSVAAAVAAGSIYQNNHQQQHQQHSSSATTRIITPTRHDNIPSHHHHHHPQDHYSNHNNNQQHFYY